MEDTEMSLSHQAKDFELQESFLSFLFLKKACAYSSTMAKLKIRD